MRAPQPLGPALALTPASSVPAYATSVLLKVKNKTMRYSVGAVTFVLSLGAFATPLHAAPITIASYDIQATPQSGHGNWTHAYSGTITPTGVNFTNFSFAGTLANYSGGSGTLNDGSPGTSQDSTHLFVSPQANDGTSILPVITLNLSGLSSINSILISGGHFASNTIPGAITGFTITIGGVSAALTSTATGPACSSGPCDDLFTLTGTALDGVVGSPITLSNELGTVSNWFSIGEITLDGTAQTSLDPVPDPATRSLLGVGLAGAACRRFRKRT